MAKTRRSYSPEYKQEAVRLVVERGLTRSQVADDLGICRSLVGTWVRDAEKAGVVTPESLDLADEVRRLRRENAVLREERELLKKAAAFVCHDGIR